MNSDLSKLHPYPFEKLAELQQGCQPPEHLPHISLSIGEPKHPTPGFITEAVINHLEGLSVYPSTIGIPQLRQTIANWLDQRFQLAGNINPQTQILPVNGTREALFALAQAVVDRQQNPLIVIPNPFYQIYEGAAILAGAKIKLLDCTAENGFVPDFKSIPDSVWAQCQLLYLCSPGNPTGAVIDAETLTHLIQLSHEHNFIIAADECYSEIYFNESLPPVGLLQAAVAAGYTDLKNCIVFHSLSKRSNVPGMRSGFVAGDAGIINAFRRYRTYHGCAMAPAIQHASIAAWQDEAHVVHNRQLYREKFKSVQEILSPVMNVTLPDAGFYLWPETPMSDTEFTRELYHHTNVTVLPGRFLARDSKQGNPGINRIRIALVASHAECVEAASRIRHFIESLN